MQHKPTEDHIKPYPINAFWACLSCFGPGWRFCVALLGTRFLRKNAACLHPWQICCANREHQIPFDTGYCTNSCRDHGITWNYCIRKYVHMPIICQCACIKDNRRISKIYYMRVCQWYPQSVWWSIVVSPPKSHGWSSFPHISPTKTAIDSARSATASRFSCCQASSNDTNEDRRGKRQENTVEITYESIWKQREYWV